MLGFQGELESGRELDYETGNIFSLTISVIDRGQPSRNITHSVIVNVTDVNDCVPDFGFTISSPTRIDEERPNGQYRHCINVTFLQLRLLQVR